MIKEYSEYKYVPLSESNTKFISTGILPLDYSLNGLQSGTVTLITGRSGEGKSTFVHGILLQAINNRKRVALIDGEHYRNDLYGFLYSKVIGNYPGLYTEITRFMRPEIEPKKKVREMLDIWFKNKLFTDMKYENDFKSFENMFKDYLLFCKSMNIDMIIFDNLMSLVDSTQVEMNAKQSKFAKLCDTLAKSANVVVILVAHVNGTAQKGMEIDYYQISGSADLVNLSTSIIQVIKDPIEHILGDIQPQGRLKVLKGRKYGEEPRIDLAYDPKTRSLCEIRGGVAVVKEYNWRMEGEQNQIIS